MNKRLKKKNLAGRMPGLSIPASFPTAALLTCGSLSSAFAGPTGGVVVEGQATISTPSANATVIDQSSQQVQLNWNTFDVGASESVRFNQPSTSSVALNRILDQNPSQIFGSIEANGQIILVNPNGLLFGPSAQLNVGSLVASSLDVVGFDAATGRYSFGMSDAAAGAVLNEGSIAAGPGGSVTLLGAHVSNTGSIVADFGTVNLAAGRAATIDLAGDGLLRLEVDAELLSNEAGAGAAVTNGGTIQASGGRVLLTAQAVDGVFANLVNNTGVVQANRIDDTGGTIRLLGAGGTVRSSGTLDASAGNAASDGGTVEVLGEHVGLFGNARVDVSGANGGGTALIGGDYQGGNPDVPNAARTYVGAGAVIDADAGASGDGGRVIVWSDEFTRHDGHISARGGTAGGDGGFAEVSGKQSLAFAGTADLGANRGVSGTLLLDPENITIDDSATPQAAADDGLYEFNEDDEANVTIGNQRIQELLATGSLVLQAEGDITQQAGANIDVSGDVNAESNSLTLEALNDITLGADIALNDGALVLDAGNDITVNGAVDAGSGNVTLTAAGAIGGGGLMSGNALTASASAIGTSGTPLSTNVGSLDVTSTGGGIFITEANALGLTANAVGGGVDVATTNGALTVASVNADDEDITLTAGGAGMTLNGAVNAGSGNVTLTAAGAVGGAGQISGSALAADGTAIGTSGTRLSTNVTSLSATSTGGAVFVTEADALALTASATGGAVEVQTTNGALTVASASGNGVTLTAGGAGNGITVNGAVNAGIGDVMLDAGSGAIAGSGLISGDELTATGSAIGASGTRLNTTVASLDATSTSGGIFVTETDGLDLTADATGDANVTSTAGDIVVETLSVGGDTTLAATAGSIADDGDNSTRIATDALTLTAGGAIGATGGTGQIDTSIASLTATASSGGVYVGESNDLTLTNVSAAGAGSDVSVTSDTGNIVIGTVTAPDAVTLTATAGAIADDANDGTRIAADTLTLSAATNIGAAGGIDRVDTQVDSLTATGSGGGVFILEQDGLTALNVSAGGVTSDANVTSTAGDIVVETLSVGGNATLAAAAGSITDDGDNTTRIAANALMLTANGAIGAATTTGQIDTNVTSLNATSTNGAVFVTEADALALTVSATGGAVEVQTTNGALTVTSASGSGVTLTAGGAGNGITVNGAVNAGAGDVVLDAGTVANRGAIVGSGLISGDELTATGSAIGTSGTRLSTNVGSLDVTSTGGGIFITEANALNVTASATGGTVDVQTTNGALTVTAATGDGVALSAGGAGSALTLNGAVNAGADDVTLTAAGAIAGGGLISGDALAASGSEIGTLGTRLNTNVASLNATSTNGGIFVTEANGLNVTATAAGGAGDVNVTSTAGDIVIGTVNAANAVALTAAAGALSDDDNDATAIDAVTGVTLSAATNIGTVVDFDAANDADVGSSVDVQTDGALSASVASDTGQINLNIAGAPALAAGAITLGSGSGRAGAIVLQSGGDLNVAGLTPGAINIGSGNTTQVGLRSGGTLTLPSGGGFTDQAADRLLVRGATDIVDGDLTPREFAFAATALDFRSGAAGGDTTLNTTVGRLDALIDNGTLTVNEADGVVLGSVGAAGDVIIAANGAVADDNDDLSQISGNAVTLSGVALGSAGNELDTQAATLAATATGGGVYVREGDALALTANATAGPVDVQTASGALTVASAAGNGVTLSAGGAGSGLTLNGAVNGGAGNVTLTAGTAADRGAIVAGAGNQVTGNVVSATGAAIGTSGARLNTNAASLDAMSTDGGIFVTEANALALTASATGAVDVQTTNGGLTVNSAAGSGVTLSAGGADSSIALNGVVDAGAGDVTLTAGTAADRGAIVAGAGHQVIANVLEATGSAIGTSGARLNTSVDSLSAASTNGGVFVTDANGLDAMASASGGAVDVRTTNGALTVISASGNGVTLSAGGAGSGLALNGAVNAGAGDVTLTAGSAASRGAIGGGGVVSGDALAAIGSTIGTNGARLNTDVASLTATSTNGGIFVTEANALALTASAIGAVDVQTTNGALTVSSASGNEVTLSAGGAGSGIALNGAVNAGAGNATIAAGTAASRGAITGDADHQISADVLTLEGSTLGTSGARLNTAVATLDTGSTSGGTFVTEANDLTLTASATGGEVDVQTVDGSLTVDTISGTGATLVAGGAGSAITLNTSVDVGSGDVTLTAGSAADRGTIQADTGIQISAGSLTAIAASIGSSAARLNTNVASLDATSASGGIFIAEADAVNVTANATGGAVDVETADGAIAVASVSGDGVTLTAGGAGNAITVNGAVNGGAGDVTLVSGTPASRGAIVAGAGNRISGSSLTASGSAVGSSGARLNTNVDTLTATADAGGVYVDEQNGLTLATVTATGSGANVQVSSTSGDIVVADVNASGAVSLTASGGAIADDGDNETRITGGSVTLLARSIGAPSDLSGAVLSSTHRLDTEAATLDATATAGGIFIDEASALQSVSVQAAGGAMGDIELLTQSGDLNLQHVSASDTLLLAAGRNIVLRPGAGPITAQRAELRAGTMDPSGGRIGTLTEPLNLQLAAGNSLRLFVPQTIDPDDPDSGPATLPSAGVNTTLDLFAAPNSLAASAGFGQFQGLGEEQFTSPLESLLRTLQNQTGTVQTGLTIDWASYDPNVSLFGTLEPTVCLPPNQRDEESSTPEC